MKEMLCSEMNEKKVSYHKKTGFGHLREQSAELRLHKLIYLKTIVS